MQLQKSLNHYDLDRDILEKLYFETTVEVCNQVNKNQFTIDPYNQMQAQRVEQFWIGFVFLVRRHRNGSEAPG